MPDFKKSLLDYGLLQKEKVQSLLLVLIIMRPNNALKSLLLIVSQNPTCNIHQISPLKKYFKGKGLITLHPLIATKIFHCKIFSPV